MPHPRPSIACRPTRRQRLPRDSAVVHALVNPYAAVPSMHVANALMLAVPIARPAEHRLTRVVWLLYSVVLIFVIVATANHFFTDALAGRLAAAVAA
jgi:membrane-associated phospholipid phosphatase